MNRHLLTLILVLVALSIIGILIFLGLTHDSKELQALKREYWRYQEYDELGPVLKHNLELKFKLGMIPAKLYWDSLKSLARIEKRQTELKHLIDSLDAK